jgi:hypothetical protein
MPDNDDKGKIIDLWKRSRQKIKERRQRNSIRRFILIAFFLVINGGLLSFSSFLGSPDLANSILISRMPISEPINLLEKQKKNSINAAFINSIGEQRHFWLMGLDLNKIIKQIRSQNPLINKIEIKPIIWDGSFTLPKPRLIVNYAEETPWARSNAGWLHWLLMPYLIRIIPNMIFGLIRENKLKISFTQLINNYRKYHCKKWF